MEFFLNWAEFSELRETDNHWSMNWPQFKDTVSHMCLAGAGAVVASWSFTQQVAGSSPFTVMTNIFVTKFSKFSGNI